MREVKGKMTLLLSQFWNNNTQFDIPKIFCYLGEPILFSPIAKAYNICNFSNNNNSKEISGEKALLFYLDD